MIIYFRVCEKTQTISGVGRFSGMSKTDIIKLCWKSLQQSVRHTDKIIIIHDQVSYDLLSWLENSAATKNIEFIEVQEHPWDYHGHTVTVVEKLIEESTKFPNELHYLVEDDYLHTPNALDIFKEGSRLDSFLVPYDYIDRYRHIEPCIIYLLPESHWRTVNSSTLTVAAKGELWLQHKKELRRMAPTSNDQELTTLYKTKGCFSPIPGVASHMTEHHMTPLVDWNKVIDNLQ